MLVVALNFFTDHRTALAVPRRPNEVFDLEEEKVKEWTDRSLVKAIPAPISLAKEYPWGSFEKRDLRPYARVPGQWKRVVACLNIWNDLPDLIRAWKSWYPFVDHVIVVDGAYQGTQTHAPYSTDGLLDYLKVFPNVEIVEARNFWPSQHEKRTEYLKRGQDGDLLLRIDADEFLEGSEHLAYLTDFDVGWATCVSPLYNRSQSLPILYKWKPALRYSGRHHWLYHGDALVTTAQIGGRGYDHARVPLVLSNTKGLARSTERTRISQIQRGSIQVQQERSANPNLPLIGHEPLRIVQLTSLDPGRAVYRLHSALNTTTPHDCLMGSQHGVEPEYASPKHLDLKVDREILRKALREADVVHCHMHYHELLQLGVDLRTPVIIHHHGTVLREGQEAAKKNDKLFNPILRLVSNLELLQYNSDFVWLPNALPVSQYKQLARQMYNPCETFRVAHSPTNRDKKGTATFLQVIANLKAKGRKIEAILIEKQSHAQALKLRATCDVTFDSFWLGIQMSGLEGAAMDQPVLAGDPFVATAYEAKVGYVPYTFVDDGAALESKLEELMGDHKFFIREAERVAAYCAQFHDYPVVALNYLNLLDTALGWRQVMRVGTSQQGTYIERVSKLELPSPR